MNKNLMTRNNNYFHQCFDSLMEELGFPTYKRWFDGIECENGMNVIIVKKDNAVAGYKLQYELPGFTKDDISVSLDNGVLCVEAEHQDTDEKTDKVDEFYEHNGIEYRKVSKSYRIADDIDCEGIECSLENGILTVYIPLKEESKKDVKKIEVK